ncbi:MAG: Na+/H+ antiporter NhaC family protein [Gammaproteobacteria bacterium]|nr:Na+/H+ antiporter NhaC family protein [Gammaproteobacteria bacterium]
MLYNKTLKYILYVIYLLFFSTIANAAESVPQAAGSWFSILPPLLTIAVALAFKRVVPALFLGIWMGAWIINDFGLKGFWTGLLDTFQVFVLNALANPDHTAIVLFSMMVGGMVGIISHNGGMQGIVNHIVKWADSARHACLATASLGLAIFFDDYANTLVVGNTMRPVTDSMRVSREKLAYIVDSTAAPVACIAIVTTWIGYEIGLIGDSLSKMEGLHGEAYLMFLNTIPYSFYPIMAIAFVFMVSASGRDFGPMLEAERHAQQNGSQNLDLDRKSAEETDSVRPIEGKPQRAFNAYIPILVMVLGVVVGLYVTGKEASSDIAEPTLQQIIGNANSYIALMWASLTSMMTAALLSLVQRIMNLEEVVNAWFNGLRAMLMAMIILILAWSLGEVSDVLKTADFLVSVLGDTLPVFILPTMVFLLAAATAFATGSSWGAMGILFPLAMPLTWAVMVAQGQAGPEHMHILYSSISAILAGAVWGDHCSPISDTTILSSLASGCDHIEHVRTQLPYALTVGGTAILIGSIPTALGLPWWLGMSVGLLILWLILKFYGKPSYEPQAG